MKNLVKLYLYNIEPERTIVEFQEAEDFGHFMIATIDGGNVSQQQAESLHNELAGLFPDKKILLVDKNLDLRFYGVKETLELEPTSAS